MDSLPYGQALFPWSVGNARSARIPPGRIPPFRHGAYTELEGINLGDADGSQGFPGTAVRDTRGHDWYATGKLIFTELMIGIGFEDSAPTEYRDWRGEVESLTRADLLNNGDARVARQHLLRTARKSAELDACGGGGALLCLAVFGRQNRRRTLHTELERAYPQWSGAPEGLASPQTTVVSEPGTTGKHNSGKDTGKSIALSTERRKRRKRDGEEFGIAVSAAGSSHTWIF